MIAFRVPTVEEQWADVQLHDSARDVFIPQPDGRMLRVHHCVQCDIDARDARLMRDTGDEDPLPLPPPWEKLITYCGQRVRVACDGKCSKAWGINTRPRVQLTDDLDDYAFLADGELGTAPEHPGTTEGDHAKPIDASGPADFNKWCVRECERMEWSKPGESNKPIKLRDFSRRRYNINSRNESGG